MLRALKLRTVLPAALLALCILAPQSRAGDYDNHDFSLRFPAALTRFAGYADVAAVGNSSAGSKWSTSINPASTAWLPATGKLKLSLTPQFNAIAFDEGTRLYVTSEALTWETPGFGTILPAAAQVWSNNDSTALGPDLKFKADILQLQWGIHPDPKWAVGFNFNYTDSEMTFSSGDMEMAFTHSQGIDLRGGVLYAVTDKLRAGAVIDWGSTTNHNDALVLTQYGPFPVSYHSNTEQFLFRPGVSYEYAKDSTIYADYQMVLLSDSFSGHMDLHRFSAGIDHQIFKGAYLRAGALVDTTGHFSWTCGAAVAPASWISIDAAYQHDFFPELSTELGHSQTFTLSVSMSL